LMLPLEAHLTLARNLDTVMREGYVGRAPLSRSLQLQLENSYRLQKGGKTFSQSPSSSSTTYTGALLGVPGMGKSSTVTRWLAQYPRVIAHADEHGRDFYQVTYIHVEMTSDATSVKSLAISIISAIDDLLPDMQYHHLYLESPGRTSTEALIHIAARLIAIHHVGLVVVDELQNLASSKKGNQRVMTEVVSLCNTLKVPLVFVGTNKAQQVLGADFRAGRRSIGGLGYWGPLPRYNSDTLVPDNFDEASEWEDFITSLWNYSWVRNPSPLTPEILDLIYLRTQGVIDLAIKLFAIAQIRAIHMGSEIVDGQLLEAVYRDEFKVLHPALEAMARGHTGSLDEFADVRSIDISQQAHMWAAKASSNTRLGKRLQNEGGFVDSVAKALVSSGLPKEQAVALASKQSSTATSGKSRSVLDAVADVSKELRPTSLKQTRKRADKGEKVVYPDFSSRQNDYRRAVTEAQERGETVLSRLKALGMLKPAEELVSLD
jgi:hypothetical protein